MNTSVPLAHPYTLGLETLLRYLDLYSTESQPGGENITFWLPGVGSQVEPSPQAQKFGMQPLATTGKLKLTLAAWTVPVVTLSATDFLDTLVQLPLADEPHETFEIGSDLLFWQHTARMVMRLFVGQQYLPALGKEGRRYRAYWLPTPDDKILQQLEGLMPPLCRAGAPDPARAPSPRLVLESFLQAAVDGFIRDTYQPERLPAQPWLRALIGSLNAANWINKRKKGGQSSNYLPDGAPENSLLFDQWQRWRGHIGQPAVEKFRVCFRLEDPQDEQTTWYLRYLVQATDDPSLVIEAAQVWASSGPTLSYLDRRFDHPQEKLLEALGTVARLFPPVEQSLRTTSPEGAVLTTNEAYRFLAETAALLEQKQFGVLVPGWWLNKDASIKAHARIATKSDAISTGLLGVDRLISYQWELAIGGERISRQEFEQLVGLKQPLVRFRGEWVAINPEQTDTVLKFLDNQVPEGDLTLLDALRISASEGDVKTDDEGSNVSPLVIEAAEIEGALANIFDQLHKPEQLAFLKVPEQFTATLRPYQQRGFAWLALMQRLGLGCCLADDMGLGKTPQTIAFWLYAREALRIRQPSLLVCPTSVIGNWQHELHRFAPSLRVYTHHGAGRMAEKEFSQAVNRQGYTDIDGLSPDDKLIPEAASSDEIDVVLTSYSLLHRDLPTLKAMPWFSVVLDEAQNIKNPVAKQAQAARAIPAQFRIALTGTPVENHLTELWSILQFLNPGYLGSREAFRSRFAIPIERGHDEKAATRLKRLTAPFILRRLKTDPRIIDDLPEKLENKVYCNLTREQATLYEAVVREELEAIEQADSPMGRRGAVLRMLIRLKQVCNHPVQLLKESTDPSSENLHGRSGKLTRLTEMLEEVLSIQDRALIFTQYAEMGRYLQAYLNKTFDQEVLFLYGATPADKRGDMIKRFQQADGPSLFVLSLKAGGTGLNLTHANHVFHYDRWYNPAVENQATDRAFRIGQTRNVQVHKFICLGTLEERIDELIEYKKDLADRIVGESESWISEMSTNELRELVTLRRDLLPEVD